MGAPKLWWSGNCRKSNELVELAEAWGPRGKEIDVDIKPITDEADLAHSVWLELAGSRSGGLLKKGF